MEKDHSKLKRLIATKNPHAICSALGFWRSGEACVVTRKLRHDEGQLDELESDLEPAASDSAGQSGDAQGLSQTADSDEESVGELAETDQAYEAGAVDGLEDAADHPERAVRSRENKGR